MLSSTSFSLMGRMTLDSSQWLWLILQPLVNVGCSCPVEPVGCVCVLVSQLCLTLCDPMDCCPPGSSVHGFSRPEYWRGLPFPSPEDLPNRGIVLLLLLLVGKEILMPTGSRRIGWILASSCFCQTCGTWAAVERIRLLLENGISQHLRKKSLNSSLYHYGLWPV